MIIYIVRYIVTCILIIFSLHKTPVTVRKVPEDAVGIQNTVYILLKYQSLSNGSDYPFLKVLHPPMQIQVISRLCK